MSTYHLGYFALSSSFAADAEHGRKTRLAPPGSGREMMDFLLPVEEEEDFQRDVLKYFDAEKLTMTKAGEKRTVFLTVHG